VGEPIDGRRFLCADRGDGVYAKDFMAYGDT
jgi:hypothetical protein